MVATFEGNLSQTANKKTDSRLLSTGSPRLSSMAASQYVSREHAWYRMDWGTGGNIFPSHLQPADPGKPWNRRPSTASPSLGKPRYERPAHLFAPLGEPPRLMRNTLDRSCHSGNWTARYEARKWATELLPPRPGRIAETLGGDKTSRPFTAKEKSGPLWSPESSQRSNCKPMLNSSP